MSLLSTAREAFNATSHLQTDGSVLQGHEVQCIYQYNYCRDSHVEYKTEYDKGFRRIIQNNCPSSFEAYLRSTAHHIH